MHPTLISFGSITLHWYGLLVASGFLAAYWLFKKRALRISLKEKDATNLIIALFLSGILGARAYYVIWHWNTFFAKEPIQILMIHKGGLVFFGGLIAAVAMLILWTRWKKWSFPVLADTLAPPLALGHAISRLGCFMNGCCYGRVCDYPWSVRLNSPDSIAGIPVHPTQLYEFVGLLDIFVALLVIEKISRYPGQTALSYCILYSVLRFIVEFFRGDIPHSIFDKFTLAQVVCIFIFLMAWLLSSRLVFVAAKNTLRKIRQTQD